MGSSISEVKILDKKSIRGMILILLAGILWGCMGLFVRPLDSKGLSSLDLVAVRSLLTAVFMGIFIGLYT